MEQKDLITPEFSLDNAVLGHLKESGTWTRFLGITGFIFSILIAIVAIFASSKIAEIGAYRSYYGSGSNIIGITVMIVYLLAAVIMFIISMFLYKFGKNIKTAIAESSQEKLTTSFLNLKLHFRTVGIMTIIYLVIVVLAVVTGILASIF